MTLRSAAAVLLLASTAWAQSSDDRIYQAIRTNDLTAIRALLRDTPVDRVDAQGQTPLMVAAAFGSDAAVRLLITSGANARAKTDAGLTALHLAATNAAKVRLLLDAGADVKAASSAGRTPLIIAASANGNIDVVRLLLARGANVNDADSVGITPLVAATNVNDIEVAKLLLAHGASAMKTSTAEGVSTPLTGAARNGNTELVRLLLARKADVNAIGAETGPRVKNGLITFARVTALHMAAVSGNVDVVRMLLDAGAAIDPLDARGMTPLMFAIATDRPNTRLIRLLVQAGASPSLKSLAGESAVDWARKFNHPAVLSELKLPPADAVASKPALIPAAAVSRAATVSPQQAVEKSLPLLRTASARMMTDGGCVACHAQPMVGMAVHMAQAKGWTIPPGPPESDTILQFLAGRMPQLVQLRDAGGLPDGLLYSVFLLAAEGMAPNRTSDSIAHFLSAKQRQEGIWRGIGGSRAPIQDGDVSRTALAIRVLTAYATPARAAEYRGRVHRAGSWLAAQTPVSTEDRVMQLLGLHWAGEEPRLRQTRVRELLALQRPDGGWAQTPYLESDAYATGQVLYALRELGTPAGDAALQRGATYLMRTQEADGSWHVRNRAMKLQPYFESGFPYEHDQWISAAATAWATMALTATSTEPQAFTARR